MINCGGIVDLVQYFSLGETVTKANSFCYIVASCFDSPVYNDSLICYV